MKFIVYSPYINIDQWGTPSFTKIGVVTASDAHSALAIAKNLITAAPIVQPAVTLN